MHQSLPKTIDYIEMPSSDIAGTKEFFTAVFGWSFEDYGPDYAAFDDGRMTGGFFSTEETWADTTSFPLVVFYSAQLEQTLTDVARARGVITKPVFEFPGGRRFHFSAPGTGEFAVWSDK